MEKYWGGVPNYRVRSGKMAVDYPDGTQAVWQVDRARWAGTLTVGRFDRTPAAETCLAWLRRWIEDDTLWTPVPLLGITAGAVPGGRTVMQVSGGGVVTASGAHGLGVGQGVRIGERFGTVVTVPSATTFRLYPREAAAEASGGDAILGTREVLAKVIQPAELPYQLEQGLGLVVAFPWVEK